MFTPQDYETRFETTLSDGERQRWTAVFNLVTAMVGNHIRPRYGWPLAPLPEDVREAGLLLMRRKLITNATRLSETIIKDYEEAQAYLGRISKGHIGLSRRERESVPGDAAVIFATPLFEDGVFERMP